MKFKSTRIKQEVTSFFHAHQVFIVITAVLVFLIATVLRLDQLNDLPIDQAYLDSKTSNIKPVRFNETAIKKINSLNESNVMTPGTELPQNRQNPFSE